MEITEDGVTVENYGLISTAPAVHVSGANVTFINRTGASILSDDPGPGNWSAIQIDGTGTTIINEVGAIIDPVPHFHAAIDGSIYADTIVNGGTIIGDIRLDEGDDVLIQTGAFRGIAIMGGGNDRYAFTATAENAKWNSTYIELLAGDDLATFDFSAVALFERLKVNGGAGNDLLKISGISGLNSYFDDVYGFERVEFAAATTPSRITFYNTAGIGEIVLAAGVTLAVSDISPVNVLDLVSTVRLNGGNLEVAGAHRTGQIIGSDAAERLELEGVISGIVDMGGGNDFVDAAGVYPGFYLSYQSAFEGAVNLGDGDDIYQAIGRVWWTANGPEYEEPSKALATVDGGGGHDEMVMFAIDGRTLDLTNFINFESLKISGPAAPVVGDVRVTNADALSFIRYSAPNGSRFSLAETDAPDATLIYGNYAKQAEIVIESSARIYAIAREYPSYGGTDASYSLTIRNDGTILSDVRLFIGSDFYDGRLGTQGGTVYGFGGDDTLLTGDGDDRLDGGRGADLLDAGGGNDVLAGDWGADVLKGGAGDDRLTGGEDDDQLFGGDGDDFISEGGEFFSEGSGLNDSLFGEGGNDVLEIVRRAYGFEPTGSSIADGGSGNDRISFNLGYSNTSQIDVFGGEGDDTIVIEGLAGSASLHLGTGTDTVIFDNWLNNSWKGSVEILDFATGPGGDVIDLGNRDALRTQFLGWDGSSDLFADGRLLLVQVGADVAFQANVKGWGLTTLITFRNADARAFTADNFSGHAPVILFSGTGADDIIEGGAGNDTLNGGAGNDELIGGGGDDIYYVDSAGDRVVEAAGDGRDTVYAGAGFALEAGSEIEAVSTIAWTATDALNLTGNEFSNALYGNAGVNVLNGGGSNDVLIGFGGDDIYYADSAGDRIVEGAGQGRDTVYTSASLALEAGSEVEVLSTIAWAATDALNLTGNEFANALYGNAGANILNGGGGNDVLIGFGGDDIYYVDFSINGGSDRVIEHADGGFDTIYASAGHALGAGSEVEVLSTIAWAATTSINLTGNEFSNALYGNAGANVLNGGGGNDVLIGFGGDDIYYVDNQGDHVIEAAGDGRDTVYTSASLALEAGFEIEAVSTIAWAAATSINLTGNEFSNTLYGNAGANILNGGGGNDVLIGFGGDDIYYADSASDRVIEMAGDGRDTVYTSASLALEAGSEVEVLSTIAWAATDAINLTGNAFDNALYGNAGANVLNGGGGNDVLIGFGGDDTIIGGAGKNALHGGDGDDKLIGDAGWDELWGGAGIDRFVFNNVAAAEGTDRIQDFEDGTDRIVLENLGITRYASDGANGTVFVQDVADGGMILHATTADGRHLYVQISDPLGILSAANFSSADFLFS
ncbi:calcium-binding protein [Sphingomonas cavernae]|uniref:Calcium-binding protein n=1 Tax=Sphingomonas cavernae TaxID=2320861 RepID=A0A418WLE4_9SPHN|nr:calcium-binding protein [Sphingomonas cavernae]RJF90866.1 hypothetical protein D3876_11840 [Sphingomonas cavernae]